MHVCHRFGRIEWGGGGGEGAAFVKVRAHLGDGSGFVISSNQLDPVRVSKFETRKERNGLDAEQPSVHIIAFEIIYRLQLVAGKRIWAEGAEDMCNSPKNR